jgi:hypothetical protein
MIGRKIALGVFLSSAALSAHADQLAWSKNWMGPVYGISVTKPGPGNILLMGGYETGRVVNGINAGLAAPLSLDQKHWLSGSLGYSKQSPSLALTPTPPPPRQHYPLASTTGQLSYQYYLNPFWSTGLGYYYSHSGRSYPHNVAFPETRLNGGWGSLRYSPIPGWFSMGAELVCDDVKVFSIPTASTPVPGERRRNCGGTWRLKVPVRTQVAADLNGTYRKYYTQYGTTIWYFPESSTAWDLGFDGSFLTGRKKSPGSYSAGIKILYRFT